MNYMTTVCHLESVSQGFNQNHLNLLEFSCTTEYGVVRNDEKDS